MQIITWQSGQFGPISHEAYLTILSARIITERYTSGTQNSGVARISARGVLGMYLGYNKINILKSRND